MEEQQKLVEAIQRIEEYLGAKLKELKSLSQTHLAESKRRGVEQQSKLYMRVTSSPSGRAINVAWYYTKFWRKKDGTYHRELTYLGKGNLRKLVQYAKEWENNWLQTMVAAEQQIIEEAKKLNKALRLLDIIVRNKDEKGDID